VKVKDIFIKPRIFTLRFINVKGIEDEAVPSSAFIDSSQPVDDVVVNLAPGESMLEINTDERNSSTCKFRKYNFDFFVFQKKRMRSHDLINSLYFYYIFSAAAAISQ
jgi:hypothetical protein